MTDRLVVYVDHPNTGVHMNFTPVVLKRDDLTDKVLEIATGVWGWTPEDMDVNGGRLNAFLLNPDLWKKVGNRIKWPDVSNEDQKVQDAVTRCKISVYKSMMGSWTDERVDRKSVV